MAFPRESVLSGVLLTMLTGGLLLAHPDEPKAMNKGEPYAGPGYRSTAPSSTGDYFAAGEGPGLEFPSHGIRLMAWLTLPEFDSSSSGSDCWGYVSPQGREYAIMGLRNGTGFVDITNPGDPQILAVIPGAISLWRDMKVYDHYAYSVTEGLGGGIQVIDLSQIDSGIVTLVDTILEDIEDPFFITGSSHNVAIDEESGYLYRCGGRGNGLRIYSLADPARPVFVGAWSERYIHDAQVVTYTDGPYAGRQIAFCCSGLNGGSVETGLDILDVTDKDNIINLSRLIYADGVYSHQAWLSPDRAYLYLNDEGDEAGFGITTNTKVFDVTDLSNPLEATTFTNGSNAIGHNLYTLGNLIFEANYRSGIRVFDATDPLAPVEKAYFDSYPGNDNPSFNGMWSVFPYFPSGTFIGSDLEKGLFILRFEDCNENGSFDSDDIADGTSQDCNINGIPDECDIADGTSDDLDNDGVPDECLDCNSNGQSDIIDLHLAVSADCNDNGVPDECEEDCNGNGLLDACELTSFLHFSGALGPVVGGQSLMYTVPNPPVALDEVQFIVQASADLAGSDRSIVVTLNGLRISTLFDDTGSACPTMVDQHTFVLDRGIFELLKMFDPEGDLNLAFTATTDVDGEACSGLSFLRMNMVYEADLDNDLNGNGVPDECDPPVCQGLEATVWVDLDGIIVGGVFDGLPYFGILVGTNGDDVIVGTDQRDVLIGLGGDDVICGLGGDDVINGNRGDDSIDGGEGFDIIHGNGGDDICTNGERTRNCENGGSNLGVKINVSR